METEKRPKGQMTFSQFFRNMFLVGCIGFGGGSALIPVIENIFLKKGNLDVKENYDKDVVVVSLTPGALPIEIASGLGRRNYGAKGMIAGAFSMSLPGAIGTFLLLSLLLNAQTVVFSGLKIVSIGIAAFIISVLITYIGNVLKSGRAESKRKFMTSLVIFVLVTALTCGSNLYKLIGIDRTPVFGISTISLLAAVFFIAFFTNGQFSVRKIIVCAVLCVLFFLEHGKQGILDIPRLTAVTSVVMLVLALYGFFQNARHGKILQQMDGRLMLRDIVAWALFFVAATIPAFILSRSVLLYLGKGILSAFMSFGGGDAYLTVADGLFVESGMVSFDAYYGEIVPVVNVLPGSILCKTLLGVGYYVGLSATGTFAGGFCFSLAGLACAISMSCISFMAIYYLYESLSEFKGFMLISEWIRPVISGLLISVILSLLRKNISSATYLEFSVPVVLLFTAALVAADYVLLKKWHTAFVLLVNIAATGLLLLF